MFVTFPSSFRLSENLQLRNEDRLAKHTKVICDKMGNYYYYFFLIGGSVSPTEQCGFIGCLLTAIAKI